MKIANMNVNENIFFLYIETHDEKIRDEKWKLIMSI